MCLTMWILETRTSRRIPKTPRATPRPPPPRPRNLVAIKSWPAQQQLSVSVQAQRSPLAGWLSGFKVAAEAGARKKLEHQIGGIGGAQRTDGMRLTLAWLSVCLAIYCGGGHGHGNVVLSLPQSLIAAATARATKAALSHQHHQQQKKDARVLFGGGSDALRDMLHTPPAAVSAKMGLPDVEQPQPSEDFNRNADDLGPRPPQSAPQEIALGSGSGIGRALEGLGASYRATPAHRYWSSLCQGRPSTLCPQEYYRTRLAAR